jgi:hypothetical protein
VWAEQLLCWRGVVDRVRRCGPWWRSRGQSIGIAIYTWLFGLFALVVSLTIAFSPGDPRARALGVVLSFGATLLLIGGTRSALCGIRICGSMVEMRNPFSSIRVPVSDITAIGRGRWGVFPKVGPPLLARRQHPPSLGYPGPEPSRKVSHRPTPVAVGC